MGSRVLNWSISPKGRKIVSACTAIAACSTTFGYVMWHTYCLDKYRTFMAMYRSGSEAPVTKEITNLANRVLNEAGLLARDVHKFKFFTVIGFEPFHAGSTTLRRGALIGIPHHFNYKNVEDIEKSDLLIAGEKFKFSSPAGQALLKTLILSEQAQKFAIAREIHTATTHYVYTYGVSPALAVVSSYLIGSGINKKFNFYRLARSFRLSMYCVTTMMGLLTFFFAYDALTVYYERFADAAASRMGKDYVLGGIEYYEKCLEKNKALRQALGEAGKKQYTISGNEHVSFRTKHIPLTERIDFLNEKLEELSK